MTMLMLRMICQMEGKIDMKERGSYGTKTREKHETFKRRWEECKSSIQCAPVEAKNLPCVNQFLGERKVEIRRSRAATRWVVARA
jgi:hypothetical protein